jgi:hypothetical protein
MIVMLPLATLCLWAVIATIELVSRDGYGRIPTRSS